jgi:hypothetical protein
LEDLDLLDGGRVQDGTSLEHLQVLGTSVGDGSLEARVADLLDLDGERRGTLAHGGSADKRCQEGNVSEELHFEGMLLLVDLGGTIEDWLEGDDLVGDELRSTDAEKK